MATTAKVTTEGVADDMVENLRNRVSWGAIFAGVAAALVTQLLLNLLGVGIGLSALDIGPGSDDTAAGYSLGAGIWWALSGIIASLVGGVAAGRLAGAAHRDTARWHGLIAWAVTMLFVIYLLTTTLGSLIGGAFNVVSGAVGGVGRAASTVVSGAGQVVDGGDVMRQARQIVNPNGLEAAQDSVTDYLRASVSGDEQAAAAARQRAVNDLSRAAGITPAEAQARIDRARANGQQALQTAQARATEAADKARGGVATAALLATLAMVLGALAAWFGGAIGGKAHEGAGIFVDARRGRTAA